MPEEIKISFTDKILAKVFLPLFPRWIKPNHLTAGRMLLTPFVIYLFWQGIYLWGGILFLLTSFTDALDGAMARTRNQVTAFGKMFDPLADKFLICSVVYILVLQYVNVYAAWIIIILEAIILMAAFIKSKRGDQDIQANVWGKIKMILQVLGVVILLLSILLNLEQLLQVSKGTFYLAISFAILSLFTYSI
ncbi:MAG: CDP-alcohol phosphatidyltransferase family protein [Patescibacteria group bacterium]